MNSSEKKARIVCRMKSVDVTRVMPRRCATSAATVDLPVPVDPPISTINGTSSACRSASRRSRSTARSPSCVSQRLARELVEPCEVDGALAALGEIDLDAPREAVGAIRCDPDGDQRPRHQALRIGKLRVAERQRIAVARPAHQAAIRAGARSSSTASRSPVERHDVVRGEHDAAVVRERVLGDHVDRRRLDLDEIRIGIERGELACERGPVTEVGRHVHDVGFEMRDVTPSCREDRHAPLERLDRTEAQRHGQGALHLAVNREHEVGDEPPVRVQVRVRVLLRADDEDPPVRRHRRDRRSAAVEDHQVGRAGRREPRAGRDVRGRDGAGQPAARTSTADRRHPGDGRRLEVVRGGVAPRPRSGDELVDGRRPVDQLRLGRPATPHRDDDHGTVALEQPREVAGHRRLPDPLAGADHGDRRETERLELRRIEPEVGPDVREACGESPRHPAEPLGRPEHGLVRQVDDHLGAREPVDQRHAVVGRLAQLLGAADEDHPDPVVREGRERVAHDRRVVLSVDQRDRAHAAHLRALTSRSIRPVYFSYSPVRRSNWMISSCPWNG